MTFFVKTKNPFIGKGVFSIYWNVQFYWKMTNFLIWREICLLFSFAYFCLSATNIVSLSSMHFIYIWKTFNKKKFGSHFWWICFWPLIKPTIFHRTLLQKEEARWIPFYSLTLIWKRKGFYLSFLFINLTRNKDGAAVWEDFAIVKYGFNNSWPIGERVGFFQNVDMLVSYRRGISLCKT